MPFRRREARLIGDDGRNRASNGARHPGQLAPCVGFGVAERDVRPCELQHDPRHRWRHLGTPENRELHRCPVRAAMPPPCGGAHRAWIRMLARPGTPAAPDAPHHAATDSARARCTSMTVDVLTGVLLGVLFFAYDRWARGDRREARTRAVCTMTFVHPARSDAAGARNVRVGQRGSRWHVRCTPPYDAPLRRRPADRRGSPLRVLAGPAASHSGTRHHPETEREGARQPTRRRFGEPSYGVTMTDATLGVMTWIALAIAYVAAVWRLARTEPTRDTPRAAGLDAASAAAVGAARTNAGVGIATRPERRAGAAARSSVQAPALALAPQRRGVDAEARRGLLQRRRFGEDALDVPTLELRERSRVRDD